MSLTLMSKKHLYIDVLYQISYNPPKLGKLSATISKLYTRKGKRIVFLNGATLNQLSLQMWEKLGGKGVDPSVISRVVNGKRLFTGKQLKAFCDILGLSRQESADLMYALKYDWMDKLELPHLRPPWYDPEQTPAIQSSPIWV